ncbi:MAG: Hsp20/alpha crystallin family protein [Mahellales bacterium]|jgi:HSP20 family protein
MSLVEWNPFREMEREMTNFFDRSPFNFFGMGSFPKVDVYQTENDIIVKAEMPGVSKEDLNVYVEDNLLRLSGRTRRHEEFKDEHVYRTERRYGSFSRTIPLPAEVKSEQVKANYNDGILSITLPKVEPSKARGKRIDIQ